MSESTEPVPAEEPVDQAREARIAARRLWLSRVGMAVGAIVLVYGIWYLLVGRNRVSTDNAYVNAEVAQITPLVSSTVLAVHVRDTQFVKAGTVLVELDPANARIALAQAEADLAVARRRFRQAVATGGALSAQVSASVADIAQARARQAAAQAEYDKARIDLQRREALAGSGAVSGDELTSARRGFASAQAAVAAARAAVAEAQAGQRSAGEQLAAADALVQGSTVDTDPAVLAAQAKVDSARLDFVRMVMRAPIDGVVTRRQVQIGQRVALGVPVMTIVPLSGVYIEANFKENQLRRMRAGMPAEVTTDLYGSDVVYKGKVAGIGGGTGASMAIIPAQNATGNWIKVVQRLPVRIELDSRQVAEHPLRVGLSAEVAVDVSDN